MWPSARISVMGGDQAADVLWTVKEDGLRAAGKAPKPEDAEAFKTPIRARYEEEGSPYYSTARLWDDGILDPAQTRDALGLALAVALAAPVPPTKFGVFRM
jgi:3-methylcrotonyl-CoA carboxylase beta subunit